MDFFGGLATLAVGFYRAKRESDQEVKHNEAWFKLSLSLMGTTIVAFLGTFGAAGLTALTKLGYSPFESIAFALFSASAATAVAVGTLWKLSSLTKGIPILMPMSVEKGILEAGFAYTEPNPKAEDKK